MQHVDPADLADAQPVEQPSKVKGPYHYWKKHLMVLAVSRCKPLTGNATKVMLRIIAYANEMTGLAWPSLDTLADETGLSRKVVKAAIADAEKNALLTVNRSAGGNRGETHTFRPAWHLAVKEPAPSRDRVRGPSRTARGSLQGTDGVPGGHGRDPSRDPEQIGGIRGEEIRREGSSYAHAREAAPPPDGKNEASSPQNVPEGRVPLPADYQFPPEAVAQARAAGISEAQISRSLTKFRDTNRLGSRTITGWLSGGAKWLEGERAKPNPDDMVEVRDGMGMWFKRKRSTVKPWDTFREISGPVPRMRSAGAV